MTVETTPTETTTTAPADIDTSVLAQIEEQVVTGISLGDLIRRGSQNTEQARGWGNGGEACALSAAALEAKDLGYIG